MALTVRRSGRCVRRVFPSLWISRSVDQVGHTDVGLAEDPPDGGDAEPVEDVMELSDNTESYAFDDRDATGISIAYTIVVPSCQRYAWVDQGR
jgi:hypothetical protein